MCRSISQNSAYVPHNQHRKCEKRLQIPCGPGGQITVHKQRKRTNLVQEQVLLDTDQALPLLQKSRLKSWSIIVHIYIYICNFTLPRLPGTGAFPGFAAFPPGPTPPGPSPCTPVWGMPKPNKQYKDKTIIDWTITASYNHLNALMQRDQYLFLLHLALNKHKHTLLVTSLYTLSAKLDCRYSKWFLSDLICLTCSVPLTWNKSSYLISVPGSWCFRLFIYLFNPFPTDIKHRGTDIACCF